jgi:hypothetical protein
VPSKGALGGGEVVVRLEPRTADADEADEQLVLTPVTVAARPAGAAAPGEQAGQLQEAAKKVLTAA